MGLCVALNSGLNKEQICRLEGENMRGTFFFTKYGQCDYSE